MTKELSFESEIDHFVSEIESLSKALDPTMRTMTDLFTKSSTAMSRFLKEKGIRSVKTGGSEVYHVKPADMHGLEQRIEAVTSSAAAMREIPRIFLCALVHKYDAYLGRLLRVAFYVKPELLSESKKTLTFSDLAAFSSLVAAKESLIEREVESVIRESHVGQFEWLESRTKMPLRKDLASWPRFVEITERRNLFVHCDGVVSSQYLAVCKRHSVVFDKQPSVGDQLNADREYFHDAFNCIFEIGVKLGHVLWRKLEPDAIKEADLALHRTGYDLLLADRYDLVKNILSFAVGTLKKRSSDEIRRIDLINLAIAYYFSGEKKECESILKAEDWSSCQEKFRLAVAVLEHRYRDAAALMKQIGPKGRVERADYSLWPLFKEFRQSKEFLAAYHSLFGREFVLPEAAQFGGKPGTHPIYDKTI